MGTMAMVQSRKIAADYPQENAMVGRKTSDEAEADWSPTLTACGRSSVHPAGSVARVSCTLTDLFGRSSKVAAGWIWDHDSWLHSSEAWDCSCEPIALVAVDVAC